MKRQAVHGRADRLCPAAGGERHAGGGDLPQDGRLGADLLPLEEAVRRDGRGRDPAAQAARGRERQAQEAGRRSDARQDHAAGRAAAESGEARRSARGRRPSAGGLRHQRAAGLPRHGLPAIIAALPQAV